MKEFAIVTKEGNLEEFNPNEYLGSPVRYWAKSAKPGQIWYGLIHRLGESSFFVICLIDEELYSVNN